MQTRIYLKKYVNGSVYLVGHKIFFKKPGATLTQIDLSIYVTKFQFSS
jgi:hypothetical protein